MIYILECYNSNNEISSEEIIFNKKDAFEKVQKNISFDARNNYFCDMYLYESTTDFKNKKLIMKVEYFND